MKMYLKAAVEVHILFSIGLGGYYHFSADKGDGLEATLEKAGWEEEKEYYHAPFDYGDSYLTSPLAGTGGFILAGGYNLCIGSHQREEKGEWMRGPPCQPQSS